MDGGRITAVGSVPEEPGDQVVRVDGDIITAGLINHPRPLLPGDDSGWAFDCTGLGVDGVASNEIGGLFPELRMALFLARQRDLSSTTFMQADALRLATEGGARCLGRDDVGRLEPGYRADVVVWPGDDLGDVLDPVAGLVLGPERYARHVFVEGEYVVRDGSLLGADMNSLRQDLARRAHRLWPEEAAR